MALYFAVIFISCHHIYIFHIINSKNQSKFMEKDKNSKQYQSLSRTIHHLLKDFQKNRQWADINNWLHRFHQSLLDKKFSELPHQITIAKRLAQCLNPNLPAGVHSHALKVYTLILTNFSSVKNILPLMSIGLFPFFQYSSSQLKGELIKIFDQHFLNNSQSLQMIISLLNALLTGLNQNNEELSKKIYNLCDSISIKYGKIWIDGAIWVNILKSQKVRIPGFKYLMKVFKDRDKQKLTGSIEITAQTGQKQNQELQKNQAMRIDSVQEVKQTKIQQTKKQETAIIQNNISQRILSNLRQEEIQFLNKLFEQKAIPDGPHNRFPNFSLLVVNALCSCLGNQSQSLVKRAALDLVVTHLKISCKSILGKADAIILVESMLRTIKLKQYSLTRRIYTYLFDQPNSEGQYIINEESREYQIQVLIEALKNLLNQKSLQTEKLKVVAQAQEILLILDTLMTDHPKLKEILIPKLAYHILNFMRIKAFSTSLIYKALRKKIYEFNDNILLPNKKMFIRSMLKILSISSKPQEQLVYGVQLLDFYLHTLLKIRYQSNKGSLTNRKNSSQLSHKSEQDKSSEMGQEMKQLYIGIIDQTLLYLKQSQFQYQKLSIDILELSNKLLKQLKQSNCELSKSIVSNIDQLIDKKPSKIIFARLLTMHPCPKKQILLPYIHQGAFSIICISNLLFENQLIKLTSSQQIDVFYAVFKLLNCHLWEEKAIQFILQFQTKYQETFKSQIQKVQPTQWLIYWRKRNGDVSGGVIRMIKNVKNTNPLTKHLSCKWIEQNNEIISKIIDPIFRLIKNLKQGVQKDEKTNQIHMNSQGILQTYQLIQIIFETSKQSFARFFFLQKNKYLSPFLQFVFKNLQHYMQNIRSKSIQMMKFVLEHTSTYEQKYDFINSTIEVSLYSLNQIIIKKNIIFQMNESQNLEKRLESQNINGQIESQQKKQTLSYLQEIQLLEYLITININLRKAFKDPAFKRVGLIQVFESKGLFNVIVKGMSESQLPYIRTLYLDYLRDFCDLLSKIQNSNKLLNSLINMIMEKLFIMLKKHDVTSLQQIIQGRQQNSTKTTVGRTRRLSFDEAAEQEDSSNLIFNKNSGSIYQQTYQISKNDLNLQSKYAQIIQMWNSIKFFISFSINQSIESLPIVNLLSLILQSFPFSYLKYTQIHLENDNKEAVNNYQQLQEQIKNVTGLKKQVLQIFDLIWDKFHRQIVDFLIQRGDPRILIHCSTDPIKALQTILKSQKMRQIIKYSKNAKLNLPKNILHYNGQTLTKQNCICHFLYMYLMYCNFFLVKNKKLGGFLQSLLSIMRIIKNTQHIQTKLWVFQMIHLLSERILLNKQVYIEGGQKIKEQLQQITKDILDDLVSAIVKSKNFTHKTQLKTGLLSIFSKQQKQNSLYDFVKMYPPTIFCLFEPYRRKSKKLSKKQQNVGQVIAIEHYVQHFLFSQWLNRTEADFMQYLSICCIKTLISIGNNLIINIYEKDTSKIALIIKQIVICLLPVCQDKSDPNMVNVQLISEYVFKVLDSNSLRSELLKFIRKNLLQIYMANDFFKCTKKSLFYWKGIIDYCTQGCDLLSELMSKQGLFDGFLKGKTQVLRLKIKSFQRICFVIYAGKIDKYENKLRTVLESLNDVMKQQNPPPALLILMLFCMRILLMRLSQSSLNKMFRSVWPGLITTLIQIFAKQKNSRNINLLLAALKVVQLIHALELEEFHLHKWMFIIDFFGIRIEPHQSKEYQFQLKQSDILTPFVFKPYLTKLLPLHMFRCYFRPQFYDHQKQGQRREQIKRKIIIKDSNIQTLQQVQNLSYVLIQYMIDLNQKKVFVNKTQIEDVIQGDFICLDDYIFQVK